MANREGLVLDGLDLNNSGGDYVIRKSLSITPPKKRKEWAQGGDSDGAALIRDPLFENRTVSFQLRVAAQASMDLALAKVGALVDKLEEAEKQDDGLALVWTPANGTKSVTLYVLSGDVEEVPIGKDGDGTGYFRFAPLINVTMDCKPFMYGAAVDSVTDAFGSNTIANYTADAGATTNVSITGGVMQASANLTTENRLIRTAGVTYPALYDAQSTVKFTVGTTLTNFKAGVVLKRIDANNYIAVYADDTGAASRVRVDSVIGGVTTNRVSVGITRMTVSTAYWIRGRIEGSTVWYEFWTSAPTATGTPALNLSWPLAGTDITTFGQGVQGRYGLVFTPQQAAASLDDWALEPNVWVPKGSDVTNGSEPILTGTLPGQLGDVAGEGRLVATDRAAQTRRYFEWGLQWRYTDLATSLVVDSDAMTVSGYAGAVTTRAGAWTRGSVATNIIRATLSPSVIAVCNTGNLGHVGTYRVKARVWATSVNARVRLAWQEGNSVFRANDYVAPTVAGAWSEVDLGLINIPAAVAGTQRWSGRVEAYSSTAADTIDVDYLTLIPAAEGYGRAKIAAALDTTTVFNARDEFDQTAGALAAKVAPQGGTWAGAGDVDDFAVETTGRTAQRTAVSDSAYNNGRFAVLGTATYTDVVAQVDFMASTDVTALLRQGVFARYTDTSNWLWAVVYPRFVTSGGSGLEVIMKVAGSETTLANFGPLGNSASQLNASTWYTVQLRAHTSGQWYALFGVKGSTLQVVAAGTQSALATGGALATGKVGMYDAQTSATANTRNFDNFKAWAPVEAVISPGRTFEVRSSGATRQDSTGTYYGPPPAYRGSNFYVPPAGAANRTSRIVAKADRNNVEEGEDSPLTDTTQVQAVVTPRYLVVPR